MGQARHQDPTHSLYFASTDTTLGSTDSQIYKITHGVSLGVQKNETFIFHVPTLPVNLDGSYFILAQVSGAQTSAVGASVGKIAITRHVGLSDAVTNVPSIGHLGQKISVTLTVSNGGNILASGSLATTWRIDQPNRLLPGDGSTLSTHISIKPGVAKTLRICEVPVPLGSVSGESIHRGNRRSERRL